ncbi:nuclear transport factor 2 family protein [Nonomuraea sp. NPDC005983]|uniref:nuclear transport factor 2 family protein n=1 Tax=Nonomuraea sp. NPDC005983 TaxID=3155595 RepID=UPI0033A35FBC
MSTRNREFIVNGFAEFAAGNVDVLRTMLKEDFIEHSPGNPSGRDAFVASMKDSPVASARLELKRVVADEQFVAVHYHMVPSDGGRGHAVVDIWRIEDGLIAEHWDVVQPVPDPQETPHGMF